VVGLASNRPYAEMLNNLKRAGFAGSIRLDKPRYEEIEHRGLPETALLVITSLLSIVPVIIARAHAGALAGAFAAYDAALAG